MYEFLLDLYELEYLHKNNPNFDLMGWINDTKKHIFTEERLNNAAMEIVNNCHEYSLSNAHLMFVQDNGELYSEQELEEIFNRAYKYINYKG